MNEFLNTIQSPRPTLVDFFATWCGPCKMMHPILDELDHKLAGKAHIIKIDVDSRQSLAADYNIRSVPTLIIFKNGSPVWRASGVQSADSLFLAIQQFL